MLFLFLNIYYFSVSQPSNKLFNELINCTAVIATVLNQPSCSFDSIGIISNGTAHDFSFKYSYLGKSNNIRRVHLYSADSDMFNNNI